jgi:hypothetical protein
MMFILKNKLTKSFFKIDEDCLFSTLLYSLKIADKDITLIDNACLFWCIII